MRSLPAQLARKFVRKTLSYSLANVLVCHRIAHSKSLLKKLINMGKARKNVTQPEHPPDVNEAEKEHLVEIDVQNVQVKWLRINLLFWM